MFVFGLNTSIVDWNSQVGAWGVDVGARLAPNHYKSFVFVVLAYFFFLLYSILIHLLIVFNLLSLLINSPHSSS